MQTSKICSIKNLIYSLRCKIDMEIYLLITRVVLAVNAVSYVLHNLSGRAVPKRRC